VRALTSGSGWAVTNTAAGEWIEFDAVDFSSGNYEFIANYATADGVNLSTPPSKLVQLAIDGKALPATRLPGSANADAFAPFFLGQATLSHGPHDLRLTFIDGRIELDWLFLKKTDPLLTLQTSGGTFVSAIQGGNSVLQGSIPRASIYENFSCDDLNGGDLEDGDRVSLQSYDGYYLTSDPSAGTLLATARAPDPGANFVLERVRGAGAITNGQSVALRTASGGRYLTVGADASQTLDVSGVSVGDAQTFVVGLGPQ
jgi:hypothetical protein